MPDECSGKTEHLLSTPENKLYLISNDIDCPDEATLLKKISEALEAGVKWIQFRTKPGGAFSSHADILKAAHELQNLCRQASAQLFINDYIDIAKDCEAHLHIGQKDGSLLAARRELGAQANIGQTCHASVSLAELAVEQGANYISFGAFFPSKTKPHAKIAPLELLNKTQQLNVPVIAIGGITPNNATQVLNAGADVLAISNAILGTADVRSNCQRFIEAASRGLRL